MKKVFSLFVALLLVFSLPVVVAQEDNIGEDNVGVVADGAEDATTGVIEISEGELAEAQETAGAIGGDSFLSGMDDALDDLQASLETDPVEEAEIIAENAAEDAAELDVYAAETEEQDIDGEVIDELTEEVNEEIENAQTSIEEAAEDPAVTAEELEELEDIAEEVEIVLSKSGQRIQELIDKGVPGKGLQNALEKHIINQERKDEVLNKVKEAKVSKAFGKDKKTAEAAEGEETTDATSKGKGSAADKGTTPTKGKPDATGKQKEPGELTLELTDAPSDLNITALEVTMSEIRVHRTGSGEGTVIFPHQCSDGEDNDSDNSTDYPDDPECVDENDDDESVLELSGAEELEADADTVALYHNNEDECDLTDETSNDNDGTLEPNCPNESISRVTGMDDFGDALSLDGVDDYAEVSDDDTLDITDKVTMEAWINPDTTQNNDAVVLIKGVDSGTGVAYGIAYDQNGEKIKGLISISGVITEIVATQDLTNEWHYIAVTYDGSSLKLYIDGDLEDEVSVSGALDSNNLSLFLGGTTGDYFYAGEMDEMRISNVARSADEIKENFEGSPIPGDEPTPTDVGCDAGWETVAQGPITEDLMQLQDVSAVIGSTTLPACKYTQIRLVLEDAKLFVDGEEQSLKVPSGTIKLIHPFTIPEGGEVTLTLDFDAQKSVHQTGNGGYTMKPTIKVIQS